MCFCHSVNKVNRGKGVVEVVHKGPKVQAPQPIGVTARKLQGVVVPPQHK